MSRYLELIYISFRMSVFRSVEYRTGVLFQYLLDLTWYVVQFALLRTAYSYTAEVGGYNLAECYVFIAFLLTTDAVSMLFFAGGLSHFTQAVRNGGLDFYILRPMATLYQITVARVNLAALLNVVFTAFFWAYVSRRFQLHYPPGRWFLATLVFACGAFINVAMRLIIASFAFWTVEGGTLNWLFHELMRFGTKPEAVYAKWPRRLLATLMPALLMSAWPAMCLVRHTTWEERLLPFVVATAAAALLSVIWKTGLRRYDGLSFDA